MAMCCVTCVGFVQVTWLQQQVAKRRVKRGDRNYRDRGQVALFNDPKWPRMWYLVSTVMITTSLSWTTLTHSHRLTLYSRMLVLGLVIKALTLTLSSRPRPGQRCTTVLSSAITNIYQIRFKMIRSFDDCYLIFIITCLFFTLCPGSSAYCSNSVGNFPGPLFPVLHFQATRPTPV